MKKKIIAVLVSSALSQISMGAGIYITNQTSADKYSKEKHFDKNLYLTGSDVTLTLTDASITEKDGSNAGLDIHSGATAILKNTHIESTGINAIHLGSGSPKAPSKLIMEGGSIVYDSPTQGASVIRLDSYSEASLDKVTITSGEMSRHVIDLNGNDSKATLNGVTINHAGTQHGVWLAAAGTSLTMNNSTISTINDNSRGIDNQYGGKVNLTSSSISTSGKKAFGIVVTKSSEVNLAGDPTKRSLILTKGDEAFGIRSQNGKLSIEHTDIQTLGKNADGIFMDKGGSLTLKNSNISAKGDGSSAVRLSNLNTKELIFENSHLHSDSEATIKLESTSGSFNYSGGSIINAASDAAIKLTNSQTVNLNFSNGASIQGNIFSDNSSRNVLNLSHSNLTGAINGIHTANFDKDSYWKITANSNLTGDLNNNGMIAFDQNKSEFSQLNVEGNLNGDGRYHINTELASLKGDFISVKGQVTGANTVTVKDTGKEPSIEGEKLQIVAAAGGNADGKGAFTLGNKGAVVNAGTYQYELQQDGVGPDGKVSWSLVNTGRISDQGGASGNQGGLALSQGLWVEQMNNLRKRLGDLRWTPEANGAWARTYGSRVEFDEGQFGQASQKVHGIALGYDRQFQFAKGKFFTGVRIDHAKAVQDLGINSSGKVNSNDVAAYFTYMADRGYYADVLLSRSRRDNHIDVAQSDGSRSDAHYREYTRGLSVEVGHFIQLQNNWFVEPQIELSHFHLGAHSYTASNGLEVELGRGHSLTARAGSLLGKAYEIGSSRGQWFVQGGIKSEINADRDITINSTRKSVSDRGTSYYAGFGINQIFQRNHMIYMSFEYEKGKNFQRPWSYSFGFRKSW